MMEDQCRSLTGCFNQRDRNEHGIFKPSGTSEKTGCVAVLQEIAFSAFPVFCSQHLNKMSGQSRDLVT